MATTKIWPIKVSLKRVVDYAKNPEKTRLPELENVIQYAENPEKTSLRSTKDTGENEADAKEGQQITIENKSPEEPEKAFLVTGVNCHAETAFEEMREMEECYGKTQGNVAYHAYQSFKTGETDPETAHRIGVELAKKMWGTDYQVLVATHMNTKTVHNHFVVCSVGIWGGKKFKCSKKAYYRFRNLSDQICREEGLTVIQNPKGKTPRSIYFAEKNGEPTRYNLMRNAIDRAAEASTDLRSFKDALKLLGYRMTSGPDHKYPAIRPRESKKSTRLYRLGEDYEWEKIVERISAEKDPEVVQEKYDEIYREVHERKRQYRVVFVSNSESFFKEQMTPMQKFLYSNSELYRSYIRYRILLGKWRKVFGEKSQPVLARVREEVRYEDRYENAVRFLEETKLGRIGDVKGYIDEAKREISYLCKERSGVYSRLRKTSEGPEAAMLQEQKESLTGTITHLRKNIRTAEDLIENDDFRKELFDKEELALKGKNIEKERGESR